MTTNGQPPHAYVVHKRSLHVGRDDNEVDLSLIASIAADAFPNTNSCFIRRRLRILGAGKPPDEYKPAGFITRLTLSSNLIIL